MSKISDAIHKAAQGPSVVPPLPPEPLARAPEPGRQPLLPPPDGRLAAGEPEAPVGAGLPPLGEAFARELAHLRASVEQALGEASQRTLMITASVPGEGASTVAARFAQFLGEDPRLRVVLVDADLRNADPRPVESVPAGEGLATVLAGYLPPAAALRPTELGGLDVLPSEGVAGDPYALCTAAHVARLLDHLRGNYHYALLDAAPVLSAPETAVLAAETDGVILVVRAGRTKREVIQRSLDRLRKYQARVLGVVMNRQQYVIPEFIYRRL